MRRLGVIDNSRFVQSQTLLLKLVYLAHVHIVNARRCGRLSIGLTFLVIRLGDDLVRTHADLSI